MMLIRDVFMENPFVNKMCKTQVIILLRIVSIEQTVLQISQKHTNQKMISITNYLFHLSNMQKVDIK